MRTRNYNFDIIRVLAMIAVLLNHSLGGAIAGYTVMSASSWIYSICMAVSRLGVPLFLMISGALLLGENESADIKALYTKRIPKILLPFFCWSVIYYIFFNVIRDKSFSFDSLISLLFNPGHAGHLWYMYILVAIYMLLPIFQAIVSKLDRKVIGYILLLWIFFSGVLHYLKEIGIPYIDTLYANMHILKGMWGYFLAGWYISTSEFKLKKGTLIVSLGISAVILTLLTAVPTFVTSSFSENWISYSGLPVIVCSVTLFAMINMRQKDKKCSKAVSFLSEISFGIYLNQFITRAAAHKLTEMMGLSGFVQAVAIFIAMSVMSVALAAAVYYLPENKVCKIAKRCLG